MQQQPSQCHQTSPNIAKHRQTFSMATEVVDLAWSCQATEKANDAIVLAQDMGAEAGRFVSCRILSYLVVSCRILSHCACTSGFFLSFLHDPLLFFYVFWILRSENQILPVQRRFYMFETSKYVTFSLSDSTWCRVTYNRNRTSALNLEKMVFVSRAYE
jgi:hypothetical protein